MPLMNADLKISQYTTDFGTVVRDLPVRMLDGFSSRLENLYQAKGNSPCGGFGTLFRPRTLIATFSDGKRVRYPIPNRNVLVDSISTLLQGEDPFVVCIDYEGEYWPFVPSTIFNGTYRTNPLPGVTVDGKKTTGTFNYISDVIGNMTQSFSFETTPTELLQSAIECVEGLVNLGFCSGSQSSGVKARRLRGKGLVSVTQSPADPNAIIRRTYARDIKMTALDPTDCARSTSSGYACFSYVGETIKNVHRLVSVSIN